MDFRLPLELEDCRKVFEESLYQETWEKRLGRSLPWREILHLSHATSFSSGDPLVAQDISNQKTNRGPSREGPLSRASLRPQLFCQFYLQPVYRAASTRFQQVLFFSAHFHGRCFAPFLLLAYASRHLPMLRLRGRLTPNHVPD